MTHLKYLDLWSIQGLVERHWGFSGRCWTVWDVLIGHLSVVLTDLSVLIGSLSSLRHMTGFCCDSSVWRWKRRKTWVLTAGSDLSRNQANPVTPELWGNPSEFTWSHCTTGGECFSFNLTVLSWETSVAESTRSSISFHIYTFLHLLEFIRFLTCKIKKGEANRFIVCNKLKFELLFSLNNNKL